jgi:hypothetical protein
MTATKDTSYYSSTTVPVSPNHPKVWSGAANRQQADGLLRNGCRRAGNHHHRHRQLQGYSTGQDRLRRISMCVFMSMYNNF